MKNFATNMTFNIIILAIIGYFFGIESQIFAVFVGLIIGIIICKVVHKSLVKKHFLSTGAKEGDVTKKVEQIFNPFINF